MSCEILVQMETEKTFMDITECSERQIRSWCHELSPDTVCDLLVELVARTKKPSLTEYEQIGQMIGKLVSGKQKTYGDSFGNAGRVMEILYPAGVQPEQLESALTVIRVVDKLFRIANGDQGDESAWSDICGYSILELRKGARETR